jgi:cell volume regulation protein A
MENTAIVIAFIGIVVFAAHLFEGVFRRTRIPDVLMLIIIGLLIGPIFKLVTPESFGQIGPIFAVITLVIILFEAGLNLDIKLLSETFQRTMLLSIVIFLVTTGLVACVVYFMTDLELVQSLILGAIVGCTSPAIVAPIISRLNLAERTIPILIIESTITDVLAIIVAISLIDAAEIGRFNIGNMAGQMIASFILAVVMGFISALFWSIILNRIRTLQNSMFTTLAAVFIVFGVAELLGYGGAVSAIAFGITLGNITIFRKPLDRLFKKSFFTKPAGINEKEKGFFSELVFLLKTLFFIYVGISLHLASFWVVAVGIIITVLILLIRYLLVRLIIKNNIPSKDMGTISVMIPRGLASAVLAALPFQRGMEGGDVIQNVAYAVILFTIILTTLLIPVMEKTSNNSVFRKCFPGDEKAEK